MDRHPTPSLYRNSSCTVSIYPPGFPQEAYPRPLPSAKDAWNQLSDVAEVVTPEAKNRDEFIEECKSGKLDDVVAAYRTFNSVSITGKFDKELIEVLPKKWKFLAHNGEFLFLFLGLVLEILLSGFFFVHLNAVNAMDIYIQIAWMAQSQQFGRGKRKDVKKERKKDPDEPPHFNRCIKKNGLKARVLHI